MKKLNKKGISITEIIVSLALISLVIIMIMRILVDIRYEDTLTKNKATNFINQALVIKNIQDDLTKKKLTALTCTNDRKNITFTFSGSDIPRSLVVAETSLTYNDEIYKIASNSKYDVNNIRIDPPITTYDANTFINLIIPVVDTSGNHFDIEIIYTYNATNNLIVNGC